MGELSGHNLGPYRLLDQLGAGGMATVYKAYHAAMDRYVAIKVLPRHLARDSNFRARFQQEARVIARLEHRHILPVYDAAEEDGIPYLVMRYTDGGDLNGLLAGGITLARTIELLAQVAEALGYAHRQGVIHRDVKPANVLIGRDGDALLADFGIAKIYEDTLQLTGEGNMVGTPAYMAPEQLQGKSVDARTDIYALGVVLYQSLTGECPFVAETPLAVAMMHIHNPLRPPSQLKQDIPASIERVILRAMAKNPADRFQTAEEMAEALRAALVARPSDVMALASPAPAPASAIPAVPPAAPPTPAVDPLLAAPATLDVGTPQRAGTRTWWFAGLGLVALVVIAALVFILMRGAADSGTASGTSSTEQVASTGAGPTRVLPEDIRQALDTAMRQLDVSDGRAALETLKPALAAHPDDPNLLAARGIADAIYSGNDVAKADIDRALSLDANNPLAYYARGYLNQKTDKPDEAIADFTRAIELDPGFARAYYQRSRVLNYPKNDFAGERRDLDRAIELDPDLITARMARAGALYYASEEAAALPDVDYVLSLDPKHSEALHLRARIYVSLDRAADARRDFDAAATAAPDDRSILGDRAAFFIRQGDHTAALADADRLVALDGADPQLHTLRGFVLHALGREDEALAAFDKALLIGGKELWMARYGHGLALAGLGRTQEALDDLLAAQAHPDDVGSISELFYGTSAMPSVDLARAYQVLGQADKAMQALDVAIEQNGSFVAYIERGRARASAGDRDGAREDLQEALRRAIEAQNDQQRAQAEAELKKIQ
jgi:tetratricopeptide (TPR) repeat protein/tRNA A-37 threonylcarbamoyl transferase component Bud32